MNLSFKSLLVSLAFTSVAISTPTHKITIPQEHIALHDNQIFFQLDGEWTPVGEIRSDGTGLHILRTENPCMSRCTRIDFEWDYKNGVLKTSIERDPAKDKDEAKNSNQQNSESYDVPESQGHTERDHAD